MIHSLHYMNLKNTGEIWLSSWILKTVYQQIAPKKNVININYNKLIKGYLNKN